MQVTIKPSEVPMSEPNEIAGQSRLYLEDLAVGRRFTSATHVIDAAQIKAFAGQFDPQPFHLDDETAKRTLFAGLAASGWHTAAITMRLLVESGLPLAGGIIGAGGEINWPKPTRPRDVLRVVSEIEQVTPSRSRPDRGTVRVRSGDSQSARRSRPGADRESDRAAPRKLARARRACGRISQAQAASDALGPTIAEARFRISISAGVSA